MLDKFIETLPKEQVKPLVDFSGKLADQLCNVCFIEIKKEQEKKIIPSVYPLLASVINCLELMIMLVQTLSKENVAAAHLLKRHIKERIRQW